MNQTFFRFVVCFWAIVLQGQLMAADIITPVSVEEVAHESLKPQILEFSSELFGDTQRFGFAATDFSETPKPLIVDLIPGTYGRSDRGARDCAYMCGIAKKHGLSCVAVRPGGRGNGSVYQGFGEVDVYEVIEAVKKIVPIDPQRITLTGASMGGAATWFHASHYPDVWAAAAPFCGYCDYQLWKKPGGTTFHRSPWEVFSWQSRGAAYRPANLRQVALRITHGEWDRAVGGGVPVEHSRSINRKLTALNIPHEYHEEKKTGHRSRNRKTWEPTLLWLLKQKKDPHLQHVSLTVHTLRHNRAQWVAVEQQRVSGQVSSVEAHYDIDQSSMRVTSENVERLALGPIQNANDVSLSVDDIEFTGLDLLKPVTLKRTSNVWKITGQKIPPSEKRPSLSGPFSDIFLGPVVIVYGTAGNEEATHHNRTMAYDSVRFFNQYNGGVHRGGITGENEVRIPVISDEELQTLQAGDEIAEDRHRTIPVTKELLGRANLFFFGHPQNNSELAKLSDDLPVRITKDSLTLGGKKYTGKNLAFFGIFPHPDSRRYVALLSGQTADAICWGSHMGLQLLPDFIVFEHERTIDWGFWNNQWRHVSP